MVQKNDDPKYTMHLYLTQNQTTLYSSLKYFIYMSDV